jgi:hyperosmotically inducible periplasmic protein
MKNALFAVVCTLGVVACAENRPAESPATETTSTTVTTTETSAVSARRTPAAKAPVASTTTSTSAATPTSNGATTALDTTHASPSATDTASTTTASGAAAAAPNPGVADGTKDATNTKINDRDRHDTLTPMDQGGGKDRDITAAIRRAVVSDGSLSFNAKNVKIITVGGKVTLRGPVKSDAEKATIEAKAKAAAGVTEVDNQLEVKK